MVVVLFHHLGDDLRRGRADDVLAVAVAVLGPGENAVLIAEIVFERGVGIVREAHEIHAEVLHGIKVRLQIFRRDRRAFFLGLLVKVRAVKDDPLAVQRHVSARPIPVQPAETGRLRHLVHRLAIHIDGGLDVIKLALVGAPKLRLLDRGGSVRSSRCHEAGSGSCRSAW